MTDQHINPEKVTKPIQLLAAWLVGLILVNASFLLAAQQVSKPEWASGLLIIAAVANIPIFIGALFLLQTKFRPQMQEDSYYSQYLQREKQFTSEPRPSAAEVAEKEVVEASEKIVQSLGAVAKGKEQPIAEILRKSQHDLLVMKHGRTRTLAELYVSPQTWSVLVDEFGKGRAFIRDIEGLLEDGLVEKKYKGYRNAKLTALGLQIAKEAEKTGNLFSQRSKSFWERSRRKLAEAEMDADENA
jgi:hypothetical protein